MERHIAIVAVLRLGLSILGLITGVVLYVLLSAFGYLVDDVQLKTVLSIIVNIAMVVLIVLSIPGIIAGIGLLKRKEWARILTLILSALDLVNFPLGTALGIYSIWALVQPEVVAEFKNTNSNVSPTY